MTLRHDLTGKKIGRLTVILFVPGSINNPGKWECLCDCGKAVHVLSVNLRSGGTRSCGCLKSMIISEKNTKHGGSNTKLYGVWYAIKMRCLNKNNKRYSDYGGRGIKIYSSWEKNFSAFRDYIFASLGDKPSEDHSLDRIDNDGNYEPGNLRWATRVQQSRNNRHNSNLTLNGVTKTISDWSKITGIGASTIQARINRLGWSIEKTLQTSQKGN